MVVQAIYYQFGGTERIRPAFGACLHPYGINWAESIVCGRRQVNQAGNVDRETAIAPLYRLGSTACFSRQSENLFSQVSFRMAGLWQSSRFLAQLAR